MLCCGLALTLPLALGALLPAHLEGGVRSAPELWQRPDFSGRWVPVYERWHGVDYLLELQDARWIVRRAHRRIGVVDEIRQTEDSLLIETRVALPLPLKKRRYVFDNRVREEPTLLGEPSRVRHYWEDGSTLVHVRELEDPKGRSYTLVARRRLVGDGDTMEVKIVARVPGEPEHRALQVYERER